MESLSCDKFVDRHELEIMKESVISYHMPGMFGGNAKQEGWRWLGTNPEPCNNKYVKYITFPCENVLENIETVYVHIFFDVIDLSVT
jgi:hypothetical protein